MDSYKNRWIILIASCVINLCAGSLYAWSVFSTPMTEYLNDTMNCNIETGGLAVVFTVANMVGPITMILGGVINDKIGPKWMVFLGGIIFGGGMLLSGFATTVIWLIITYGFGCGLGMGMIYGCNISNSIKFFPDKKGLVGGLTTASYGISSVIIPPIANYLNETVGVACSFRILGIAFLIIICGMSLTLKQAPAEDNYTEGLSGNDLNWRQMLKSKVFYIMLVMMTCGAISGLMCISQASPIAVNVVGLKVSIAAIAVSTLALFNTAGRVVAGYVSDKIGRNATIAIAFALSTAGLLMLYFTSIGSVVLFYTGIAFIGIAFGAIMGVFPALTAEQFGMKNNSVNYGIMFIGFAVAGYLGPTIMKFMLVNFGNYKGAFTVAMAFTIIGGILLFVFTRMIKGKALQQNT